MDTQSIQETENEEEGNGKRRGEAESGGRGLSSRGTDGGGRGEQPVAWEIQTVNGGT